MDNIAVISYMRNKLHKWKNIAILSIIFSVLLVIKFIFIGPNISSPNSDFIAEVKIEGVIFEDEFRTKVLNKVANDDKIKAVLVNINSPGGGIVGSEILYQNLKEIAKNKPIVVLMGSVAASGGYMAAVASDYIIARNGTLTGSIGVIMEAPEVSELAKKIGIKVNSYKSSSLKGSPSLFEKSNLYVDRVIQDSIDDSYKFFVSLILDSRADKINKKFQKIAFDGRVFTGRQALKVGLVDQIGTKQDATNYLLSRLKDKDLEVREVKIFEEKNNFAEKIFGLIPFLDGTKISHNNPKIMAILR